MTQELTGLPVANAGLLDEGSSAVEALNLMHSHYRKKRNTFLVSDTLHPQTLNILKYKARNNGNKIVSIRF